MLRKNNIGLVTLEEKLQICSTSPSAVNHPGQVTEHENKKRKIKYLCLQIFELPETLYFCVFC